MINFEFDKVYDDLENEYGWDYVEQEGMYSVRFDHSNNNLSMWVYSDGSVSGEVPNNKLLKEKMESIGIIL